MDNRFSPELYSVIGVFSDLIPIRFQLDKDENISDLIKKVSSELDELKKNKRISYSEIINIARTENNFNYSAMPEIVLSVQNFRNKLDNDNLFDHSFDGKEYIKYTPLKYDLHISIDDSYDDKIKGEIKYKKEFFDSNFILTLKLVFNSVLNEVCVEKRNKLSEIKLISCINDERAYQELNKFSDQENGKLIQSIFKENVNTFSNKTAIIFDGKAVSYKELNSKSCCLANSIRDHFYDDKSKNIGLYFERSLEMIVAIISIIKLGCAYVPIDPNNPDERVRYIIQGESVNIF